MLVVGTLVVFAGAVVRGDRSASRALLLLFVLPITVPGAPGGIPPRLLGWAIAAAVVHPGGAAPVAAPRARQAARGAPPRSAAAARCCGSAAPGSASRVPAGTAVADAFATCAGRCGRPRTGRSPSHRSRLLLRLADELEWLHQLVRVSEPRGRGGLAAVDPGGRRVVRPRCCRRPVTCCGPPHPRGAARGASTTPSTELAENRLAAADELADELTRGIP